MPADCPVCQLIAKGNNILYEDEKIVALLEEQPMASGHIIVTTREHYPIIEQVPDFIIDKVFQMTNKLSTIVFDALGCQGTNIIVNNGIAANQETPHFIVNIIPRRENDGVDFAWKPKQLSEEEMSTVELNIKEQTQSIGAFEEEKEKPIEIKDDKEVISESDESEEDNYQIKQLRRVP